MDVPDELHNFAFHGRYKTFPYCQMSILPEYSQRDIISQFYQVSADGVTEPVRPVTSFFAIRIAVLHSSGIFNP